MFLLFNQIENINVWELLIIGMLTVFIGLVIIQFFINMLKLIMNRKKKEYDTDEEKEDIYNKDLLKDINLTKEQLLAVLLGIAIEYELYYSDEKLELTFNFPDKEPLFIQYRETLRS